MKTMQEKQKNSESHKDFTPPNMATRPRVSFQRPLARIEAQPIVYVIGRDEQRSGDVFRYIDCLSVMIRWDTDIDMHFLKENRSRIGTVILLAGDQDEAWLHDHLMALQNIRAPIMGILPNIDSEHCVDFYQRGVDIMFNDSHGISDIPRFIAAFITHKPQLGLIDGNALERAIDFRIKLEPHFELEDIQFSVDQGHVVLRGLLGAVWKWQFLSEIVARIPGVVSVDTRNLVLVAKPLNNIYICEKMWNHLLANCRVNNETLLVSSDGQSLTVSGVLSNRTDIAPSLRAMEELGVVDDISRTFIESKSYQDFCLKKARAIYDRIQEADVTANVRVSVCGAQVELSGWIDDDLTAEQIVKICLAEEGIEHVINTCTINQIDYPYVG